METKPVITDEQNNDEEIPVLTPEQEKEIVSMELKLLPANEKLEIEKVVSSGDIILINRHKEQVKSFKRSFPASKFVFIEGEPLDPKLYEKALAAWRKIKDYRTKKVTVDFKSLKSPLNTVLKFYNDNEKPITEDLKKIELAPGEYVDKYEAAQKAEKLRAENELKIRTANRVELLIKSGAAFDGEYYSVGSEEFEVPAVSLGMVNINSIDDVLFDKILAEITEKVALIAKKQKIKDDAAAQKKIDDAAEEKRKSDKLIEDQKKIKEQNQKLRSKELKLLDFILDEASGNYTSNGITITKEQVENLDMDEWEGLIEDAEVKINHAKSKAALKIQLERRGDQLRLLGMKYNSSTESFEFDDITVGLTSKLAGYDATQWQSLLEEIQPQIVEKKLELENARIKAEKENELKSIRENALAPYWQFVTPDEKLKLGKLEDATYSALLDRVTLEYNDKVKKDTKDKEEKEKKEKADELAKQGDEAMYKDYVLQLEQIKVPAVTTVQYINKIKEITVFIEKL